MNINSKVKIKISNNAYDFLVNLLKFHTEYDCISLEENLSSNCCKAPKVELVLNKSANFDVSNKIDEVNFCYNLSLCTKIKEITIILNNSNLHTKVIMLNEKLNEHNCSGCKKKKGNCTGCK